MKAQWRASSTLSLTFASKERLTFVVGGWSEGVGIGRHDREVGRQVQQREGGHDHQETLSKGLCVIALIT